MLAKRNIAVFLMISLLCCSLLVFPVSAESTENMASTNPQPQRVSEILERRTANSETYLLSDGSYECVIYAGDKYYQTDTGSLVQIDNSIIMETAAYSGTTYDYGNESGAMRVSFADRDAPGVRIEKDGCAISFSPVDAVPVDAAVGGSTAYTSISDIPMAGSNYISYENVYPYTDIVYAVDNDVLKEYIILKNPAAPTAFSFKMAAEDCAAAQSADGIVSFYDDSGEKCFELANLFAIDAAGAYTDELQYTFTDHEDGTYLITVELDESYVMNMARSYPIVIDPSVMVSGSSNTYDSFVSSLYPSSNYYLNTYLRTGKDTDYGIRRSVIKFDIPSFFRAQDSIYITSAQFRIRRYTGSSATSVKIYRSSDSWSSSSVTWNNQPGYGPAYSSALSAGSDNWYSANVTNIVTRWVSQEFSNYGFLLKDTVENSTSQWTMFYSSDASYPNRPELNIYYVENQYGDYGYASSTIPVKLQGYYENTNAMLRQGLATWNNTSAPITFVESSSSGNLLEVVSKEDMSEFGYRNPDGAGGFDIKLNTISIQAAASNYANFFQSTLVHELGHVLWLGDNPVTPEASIMKYSRDRDTMTAPSSYDVANVTRKYG